VPAFAVPTMFPFASSRCEFADGRLLSTRDLLEIRVDRNGVRTVFANVPGLVIKRPIIA